MLDSLPGDGAGEFYFGPHLFRWEPPDLGYIIYDGSVDGAMVTSLSAQSRRFLLEKPSLFMLVDVTRLTKLTAEARRLAAENSKDLNLRGVAIVGASSLIRVVAGLVSRAVELLTGNTNNPTRFFDHEHEARAWIADRRGELPATR